jgi:uncharacterized protein YndB with AHSA1/START domain
MNPKQPDVIDSSFNLPDGGRVLRHEVVVGASQAEVWQAFTTSEGLHTFIAPVVALDFRIGGKWESTYDPDGKIGAQENILNEVICYLPMEMLSIRIVRTPPRFPYPEIGKKLWTVIQLKPEDESHTRVVTSMLGWQAGPEWDEVYSLFQQGNALTSQWIYERFMAGPKQWK